MSEDVERYRSTYSYDKNGNLKTLDRYDANGDVFDNFIYEYNLTDENRTNQLERLVEQATIAPNGNYGDIEATYKLTYDSIGNLITDESGNITNIEWFTNGKIKYIEHEGIADAIDIEFAYDATGSRISKTTWKRDSNGDLPSQSTTIQHYIRDASGNVMANYNVSIKGDYNVFVQERPIYGSSRIGIDDSYIKTYPGESIDPEHTQFELSLKTYELSNHLGNVLETINDHKIAYTYLSRLMFGAEVLSMSDYFPFGMRMKIILALPCF